MYYRPKCAVHVQKQVSKVFYTMVWMGLQNATLQCRDPGCFRIHRNSRDLNHGPSDLQSDALPTERVETHYKKIPITKNKIISRLKSMHPLSFVKAFCFSMNFNKTDIFPAILRWEAST